VQFSAPLDVEVVARQLDPTARILDLGCGYGRVMAQLYEAGFRNIVGYDSAAGMIKRGHSAYPDLTLKIATANAIPEAQGSFDAIIASALLTSVPGSKNRASIIAEMKRLLAHRGIIFGVDFLLSADNTYDENGCFVSTSGIAMKHFTVAELRESFGEFTGWECRKVAAFSLSGNAAVALQYAVRLPANKSLQATFDPPPIFADARTAAASNAPELRR
jgi:SAM-dependent methyltransferase